MKALVLDQPGSFDHLHIAESALPEPGPGEVRVEVHAASLNPVDYKLLLGGHPAWTYPFILGLDVAGIIDAVGEGVTKWQPGDRVFYHGQLSRPGGYAEYAVTGAYCVARIPDALSFVDAAALPCAGMTAYQALFRKWRIQAGEIALIHAGAGGVGGFGIQLAADAGATVITTCSPRHNDAVKKLGAQHTIDYKTEDIHTRVMEITGGRGVDVVVDVIGKESATAAMDMLAFGGGLVCIEALPDFSAWQHSNAISVHDIALGGAHFSKNDRAKADLAHMAAELAALVVAERVNPMVSEIISLEEVPDALSRLAQRHVRGKIVSQIKT